MHGTNVKIIPIYGYNMFADEHVQIDAGCYEIQTIRMVKKPSTTSKETSGDRNGPQDLSL